jgi:large subunit ribosomal protein L43
MLSQNGVGAFVVQCKRLDFHYCDWAGSSRGMNIFIRHSLPAFAKQNPNIEITVSPRPNHHPLIRGHYVNGRTKEFCVRNLEQGQILNRVELMSQDDGKKLKRVKYPVTSTNDNVRGIWSGLHDNKISIGLEGLLAESKKRKN